MLTKRTIMDFTLSESDYAELENTIHELLDKIAELPNGVIINDLTDDELLDLLEKVGVNFVKNERSQFQSYESNREKRYYAVDQIREYLDRLIFDIARTN